MHSPSLQMENCSLPIDDIVAGASPVLARMRLDGLDHAPLPFAERYVLAWRAKPEDNMDLNTLMNVFKVRDASTSCWGGPKSARRATASRGKRACGLTARALARHPRERPIAFI